MVAGRGGHHCGSSSRCADRAPGAGQRAAGGQPGVLRGVVADSSGAPIPGADVAIVALHRLAQTDARGRFSFAALPRRRHRAVGAPTRLCAASRSRRRGSRRRGDSTVVTLTELPDVLPGVTASGQRARLAIEQFYQRRARGIGTFFTRDEIVDRHAVTISDVLRMAPGVQVVRTAAGDGIRFTLGQRAPQLSPAPLARRSKSVRDGGRPDSAERHRRHRALSGHVDDAGAVLTEYEHDMWNDRHLDATSVNGFRSLRALCCLTPIAVASGQAPSRAATFDSAYSRESRAAMGAHHLCSGLWVVGRVYKRSPAEIIAQDVAPFRLFAWEPDFTYDVDSLHHTVTVRGDGIPARTAKFNGDQGARSCRAGDGAAFHADRRERDSPTRPSSRGRWATATRPLLPRREGQRHRRGARLGDGAEGAEHASHRVRLPRQDRRRAIRARVEQGHARDRMVEGKSITGALIGILVEQGVLTLDKPAPIKE